MKQRSWYTADTFSCLGNQDEEDAKRYIRQWFNNALDDAFEIIKNDFNTHGISEYKLTLSSIKPSSVIETKLTVTKEISYV